MASAAGFDRLKSDLKNGSIGKFYILHGQEDYLRRYYFDLLRKELLDELTESFNFHHITSENMSLRLLFDSVEALPMMAQRSLVQLEDIDLFALNEDDRTKLTQLLTDLPEHCCLVATYADFKADKRKKKLWEAIEKNAVIAEFPYQSEHDLCAWIARHVRAHGKQIDRELCMYLLSRCGMSMTRLHNEIEKLCAYSDASEIVRADIDAVVSPTLEAVVFEISDALAQRNFDRALERLHTILLLHAEPIAVLAAIGAQMRRLHAAKLLLAEGKSAELAAVCGIAPYAAKKTLSQAQRLSQAFCEQAVLLCCETDVKLKTSAGDPRQLLQMLILSLAQEAQHD
ncbi:MAG: DNA polymerase III subunit delta [Oscillospiraceae bacterium]|jgi:DNA polymerase-3 subunit delta|nr:DNA polymerase III subunit delta [Oscillospiraceae bacterium]